MNYVTVEKNNLFHLEALNNLIHEYLSETDLHSGTAAFDEIIYRINITLNGRPWRPFYLFTSLLSVLQRI